MSRSGATNGSTKKMSKYQYSNNRTVKVSVLDKRKYGVFQSKFKSAATMKCFVKALEPAVPWKSSAKESDVFLDKQWRRQAEKIKPWIWWRCISWLCRLTKKSILISSKIWQKATGLQELRVKFGRTPETESPPSNVLVETKFSKKLMGLTLAKRKDPWKLWK